MANLCTAFLGGALAGVDNAVLSFWHSVALSCGSFFTPFMEFVSVFGKGGIFPICLCVFLMLFKDTRKVGVAGLLAVGVGALFTNVILKPLIARPRPYTVSPYDEWWTLAGANSESEYSFPSGHTTTIASCFIGIFLASKTKKKSWTLVFGIILMGASRNYLMVHYFTDVVGGVLVGLVAGTIAYFITRAIYKVIEKRSNNVFCSFVLNADAVFELGADGKKKIKGGIKRLFKRKEKIMKIAVLIANGSEEIETLTPVDVLRRTSAVCDLVSVGEKTVSCSHGVSVLADFTVDEVNFDEYDAIVIPGGMPGAVNIAKCEKAVKGIEKALGSGRLVSAICASPAVVIANNDLLGEKKATCFPAEDFISALGNSYTGESVCVSENLITANGPKSALEFAFAICEYLKLTPKM